MVIANLQPVLLQEETPQAVTVSSALMSSSQGDSTFAEICAAMMSSTFLPNVADSNSPATTRLQNLLNGSGNPIDPAVPLCTSNPKPAASSKSAAADLSHPFLPALAVNLLLIPDPAASPAPDAGSSPSQIELANSAETLISEATSASLFKVSDVFPDSGVATDAEFRNASSATETDSPIPQVTGNDAGRSLSRGQFPPPATTDLLTNANPKMPDLTQSVNPAAAARTPEDSSRPTGASSLDTASIDAYSVLRPGESDSSAAPVLQGDSGEIAVPLIANLVRTPVVDAVLRNAVGQAIPASDGTTQPVNAEVGNASPAIPVPETSANDSQAPSPSQSNTNDVARSQTSGIVIATTPDKKENESFPSGQAQTIPTQLVNPARMQRPANAAAAAVSLAHHVTARVSEPVSVSPVPDSHAQNLPALATQDSGEYVTSTIPVNSPVTSFAGLVEPKVRQADPPDKNASDSAQRKDSSTNTSSPIPPSPVSAAANTTVASPSPTPVVTLQPREVQAPNPKQEAPGSPEPSGTVPALPDSPAFPAPGPVRMAQMVGKSGQSEMRIGLSTPAFGSVEVRTIVHNNDVGIVIGTERGDLRSLMASDLSGITTNLQHQNLRLNEVNFQQQGFASANNSSSGDNPQHRSFDPQPGCAPASVAEPFPLESDVPLEAPIMRGSGFSIHA